LLSGFSNVFCGLASAVHSQICIISISEYEEGVLLSVYTEGGMEESPTLRCSPVPRLFLWHSTMSRCTNAVTWSVPASEGYCATCGDKSHVLCRSSISYWQSLDPVRIHLLPAPRDQSMSQRTCSTRLVYISNSVWSFTIPWKPRARPWT